MYVRHFARWTLARKRGFALCATLFAFGGCYQSLRMPQEDTWALVNVGVVDLGEGKVDQDQTIIIRGRQISAIGPSRSMPVPAGARVVNAPGAFIIPGLFDMHAHVAFPSGDVGLRVELMRRLREGVLGIRDAGMPLDSVPRILELSAPRAPLAPRVWVSGATLESPWKQPAEHVLSIADTASARQAVEGLKATGVSFLKVYHGLAPDVFAAVGRAARASGLPVGGHAPLALELEEAVAGGLNLTDHQTGVLESCSDLSSTLRSRLVDLWSEDPGAFFQFITSAEYLDPLLDGFDPARCATLGATLAAAEVWAVPTLVAYAAWADPDVEWGFERGPADRAALRRNLEVQMNIVRILHDAGVQILVGLDGTATVHDELALLVEAGLPPAAALRAATTGPARFLGVADSIGAVAPGRIADLLVLSGNPLTDIRNTRRISSIVVAGRVVRVE